MFEKLLFFLNQVETCGNIPDSYDSRDELKGCVAHQKVLDQGDCGSCYAQAAATVYSLRLCKMSQVPALSLALLFSRNFFFAVQGEHRCLCPRYDGLYRQVRWWRGSICLGEDEVTNTHTHTAVTHLTLFFQDDPHSRRLLQAL